MFDILKDRKNSTNTTKFKMRRTSRISEKKAETLSSEEIELVLACDPVLLETWYKPDGFGNFILLPLSYIPNLYNLRI